MTNQLTSARLQAMFGKWKGPILHCTGTGGGAHALVNGMMTKGGKVMLIDIEGVQFMFVDAKHRE